MLGIWMQFLKELTALGIWRVSSNNQVGTSAKWAGK